MNNVQTKHSHNIPKLRKLLRKRYPNTMSLYYFAVEYIIQQLPSKEFKGILQIFFHLMANFFISMQEAIYTISQT